MNYQVAQWEITHLLLQEMQVQSLGWEDSLSEEKSLKEEMATTL